MFEKKIVFEISSKMDVADAVKAAIICRMRNMLVSKEVPHSVSIGAYCNGREQGYSFTFHYGNGDDSVKIMVSENRNSDNIVVYVCSICDDIPSEKAYKNKKYFEPYAFDKAVDYILEQVKLE